MVQLYFHQQNPSVVRPVKELRAFQRIALAPGEKKTVSLTLPAAKLAFFDEKVHQFVVEPGVYDIMIGSASDDIRLTDHVEVTK